MSVRSRDTFSISFMMRVVLKSGVALKRRRSEKHVFLRVAAQRKPTLAFS